MPVNAPPIYMYRFVVLFIYSLWIFHIVTLKNMSILLKFGIYMGLHLYLFFYVEKLSLKPKETSVMSVDHSLLQAD